MKIRTFKQNDWPMVWAILEKVFRSGETYAFPRDISEDDAYQAWIVLPLATFVAVNENDNILGSYFIKANQSGPGSHVCNCGYVVSERVRGQGIASEMCRHSQREAISKGFHAMQYNLVVSTNEGAIRLWKKHGFEVVGTIPDAFKHPQFGFIEAYVMYKILKT